MTISYSLKNYSWQKLIRPMLLLSVGVHGLLLFAPMPTQKVQNSQKAATQEKVKLTQLPTSNSPRAIEKPSRTAVKPSPANRQTNTPVTRQKSISEPAIRPSSKVTAISKVAKTTPRVLASAPSEISILPNPNNSNDPFIDFPKYINSQPGSLGLFKAQLDQTSQQTQDEISAVSQYFERELKGREYKVTFAKNEADTKVFEVTKGNTTKFLNLINHNGGTVIALASEILNPENINAVVKVSPEEEAFISILDKINFENIEQPDLYLTDPSLFYAKFGAGKDGFYEVEQKSNTVGTIRLIPNQLPEQVFRTIFAPTLKSGGFEVNLQGQYGGGKVYEVKQGTFITYLNLLPTADRKGTVVVSWSSVPN